MRYTKIVLIICLFVIICQGCQSKEEKEQQVPSLDRTNASRGLSYKVPDSWKEEKPSSSMRKAQYTLPGADGADDAEMAVFVFPGGGGGVQANINRWIGQFKQPDGSESMEKTQIKKLESYGLPVSIIYVTGTHLKGSMMGGSTTELKNYAMVAAIVETSTDPWFFKTIGPEVTINHWRSEFEKFSETFKQE
jgi:hypothetical protein